MTRTDIIDGTTKPFTVDELQDRRRDRQWRFAIAGGFLLAVLMLAVTFWAGYTLGGVA